jgi:hypothetical protein
MNKDKIFKLLTIILIALFLLSPLLLTIFFSKLGDSSTINKFLNTEFSNVNFDVITKTLLFYTIESDIKIVNTILFLLFIPLFILLTKDKKENKGAWLTWFLIVIPPLLFFITSMILVKNGYSPIYVKRAMIFILGSIALWFGFLISRFENKFIILFFLSAMATAMIFENNIKNHKYIDNGYKKDVELELLDPTGVVVQKWMLQGTQLNDADFGTLDYNSDSLAEISCTLRFDRAINVF